MANYRDKYGQWGVVIGASMGIGACCAAELAKRGQDVVLVARSLDKLKAVGADIEKRFGVKTKAVSIDFTDDDCLDQLDEALAGLDVGTAVYSAAWAHVGGFLSGTDEFYDDIMKLNVYGSLKFARYFGERFCRQQRGGMVFLGSLSGHFSTPYMALYSATKGFEIKLAESLYTEFKRENVDVICAIIGSVDTPGLKGLYPDEKAYAAMKPVPPEGVAAETIEALGTGPVVVPGKENKRNIGMLRKMMSYSKEIVTVGQQTIDATYLGNPPKQFVE